MSRRHRNKHKKNNSNGVTNTFTSPSKGKLHIELHMKDGSALLRRTRFSYSDEGLIEYSINYYNPELYEYRTNFVVNLKDKNKEEK